MKGGGQKTGNVGGWWGEGKDEAWRVTAWGMRVGVAVGAVRTPGKVGDSEARLGSAPPPPPRCLPFRSPEALSRPAFSGGRYFGLGSERGDYF